MRKSFYYNFLPSSVEEQACKASNRSYQVTRVLTEVRDVYPPPVPDYQRPWHIKNTLNKDEVASGKLLISASDMFEHVFRYWDLDVANSAVMGKKVRVTVCDLTDHKHPKSYSDTDVCVEKVHVDVGYKLTCKELFQKRGLGVDDEIGLYWDPMALMFHFNLLCKML